MREAPRDRGATGSRCGSGSTYRLLGLSSTYSDSSVLPACFGHAGDVATERELPKTDPAKLKLAQEAAWAPADFAAILCPSHELRLPLRLDDHRRFCHLVLVIARRASRARAEGSAPARRSSPW